jgi:hypothetical protein
LHFIEIINNDTQRKRRRNDNFIYFFVGTLYGGEKNYFHAPNEIDYIAPSRFQAQSE